MENMYDLIVSNDNGNSEHKLVINGIPVKHPNVFARISKPRSEKKTTLIEAINELHNNIDITISSPAIKLADNTRVLVGHAAMAGVAASKVKNMNLEKGKKHEQDLPIINTLGIVAVKTVQEHFSEKKTIENNDVLEVTVNMSTCLPASVYNEVNAKIFKERFQKGTHMVTVNIKSDLRVVVKVTFGYVGVSAEGTPPLFEIIEDGEGNYRSGDMFDEFIKQYDMKPDLDGQYFQDKNLMHIDIGDGTTELIITNGYELKHSEGLEYGLGVALESVVSIWKEKKSYTRQDISEIIKSKSHAFKEDILTDLNGEPLENLSFDIAEDVQSFVNNMRSKEIHIAVVYGGGSILLKDHLYSKLMAIAKKERFKLLWIPPQYAVDMNVNGLNTFNDIYMDELTAPVS